MKKLIALLMAVTMVFSAASTMAEQLTVEQATPDFDVTTVVPVGYKLQESRLDGILYLDYVPDKEGMTEYLISIAYSEEYDGRTLNDFTDEEQEALLLEMDDDFQSPVVTAMATESGTQVYLINETGAADDKDNSSFAIGYTIYKGYFVHIYVMRDDFDKLTADDLNMAISILSNTWFVE